MRSAKSRLSLNFVERTTPRTIITMPYPASPIMRPKNTGNRRNMNAVGSYSSCLRGGPPPPALGDDAGDPRHGGLQRVRAGRGHPSVRDERVLGRREPERGLRLLDLDLEGVLRLHQEPRALRAELRDPLPDLREAR